MASLKRWTRLLAGPAIALLATAAAAGCTSSPAATSSTAGGPPSVARGAAADLTTAQARAVFGSYLATIAQAGRTNDSALALSVVTGVLRASLAATLKGSGLYSYGTPAIYLPEPAGFPRFFVADVTQTLKGTNPADGRATWIAGAKVPLDGHVLMVFEQAAATAAWQLASISQLAAGMALPPLATDKSGYVPQVPLSSAALLARPDATGPLQAAVVDDGQASAAISAVAAGPLTTGMYQGAREHVEGLTAPRGDVYQWELEGTPYPTFALRTASGGALVLYAMYLNSTVAVPDVINKASPIRPGRPIQVPPNFLPLLPKAKTAPRESVETQQALSFAAIDPPVGPAKVTVIAIGGGPDYATAS